MNVTKLVTVLTLLLCFNASATILKCKTLDHPVIPDKFIELTKKYLYELSDSDLTKKMAEYEISDKDSYYLAFKEGEYGIDTITINKYDLKMKLIGHVKSGEAEFNYQCEKVVKQI